MNQLWKKYFGVVNMLDLKKILLILVIIMLSSCSINKINSEHLYTEHDFILSAKGISLLLEIKNTDLSNPIQNIIIGEFICYKDSIVNVLSFKDQKLYKVNLNDIGYVRSEITENSSNTGTVTLFGALLTPIVHGFTIVINLPVTLLGGGISQSIIAGRNLDGMKEPDEKFFQELSKYARYPDGEISL